MSKRLGCRSTRHRSPPEVARFCEKLPWEDVQHRWQENGLAGLKMFGKDAREHLPLLTRLEQHIKKVGEGYGRKYKVHEVIPPLIPPVREALSSDRGHPTLRTIKVKVPDYSAVKGLKLPEEQ